MFAVSAISALIGAAAGGFLYKSWKSAQRAKGIRSGFVNSSSSLLLSACGGASIAIGLASFIGFKSVKEMFSPSMVVWVPVVFEALLILSRNHVMNYFARPIDAEGRDIVEDPALAMCHTKLADRLKYAINVMNVGVTAYIFGKAPQYMYLWYTAKMALLMPMRILEFRQKRMHLFNYELCLFVNYFFLAYLHLPDSVYNATLSHVFGGRENLFAALFGLANGPVAWYIIAFDGTLSFFDRGRTTSAFIHFAPAMLTYCIRHSPEQTQRFPHTENGIFTKAALFYVSWAAFQYVVVLGLYMNQIKKRSLVCLWTEPTFDAIRTFTHSHRINRTVYFILHASIATCVMAISPLLYKSEPAHFLFLFLLAATAVWNGSSESFDRFKEAYHAELKARLKIQDADDESQVDKVVLGRLHDLALDVYGKSDIDEAKLNVATLTDVGFDSLRVGTLCGRIQDEYKIYDLEVGELMSKNLTQIAKLVKDRAGKGAAKIEAPPPEFHIDVGRKPLLLVEGETLAEKFLNTCDRMGTAVALADDSKPKGNILTYDRLKAAAILIAEYIHSQDDLRTKKRIGVMLPASVGATVVTFGTLLSGQTPVMVNFTLGGPKIDFTLEDAGVTHIITSTKFISTLAAKGVELPQRLFTNNMLIFAEDIFESFTTLDKIIAAKWTAREKAKALLKRFNNTHTVNDHAVILFTSGSTSNPKGVPLTNRNIIENLRCVVDRGAFKANDIVMAALPPFHSFGFAATTVVPVIYGLRCVYYPNPTAFFDLARQMARWRPTVYFSTPSWMQQVYDAAKSKPEWTSSLRAVLVGAERCPDELKAYAKSKNTIMIEGYGITETSPVLCTTKLTCSLGVGWPLDNIQVKLCVLASLEEARGMKKPSASITKQLEERSAMQRQLDSIADKTSQEALLLQCRLARPIVEREIAVDAKDPKGEKLLGLICVSGPNIFGDANGEGYLNHKVWETNGQGKYKFDPYIEFEGKIWYNTEDLGRFDSSVVDENGNAALVVGGRVKRFVKRGGEMISLGAIEEPLVAVFPDCDQKRSFAVEATEVRNPANGALEPRIGALLLTQFCDDGLTKKEAEEKIRSALATKFSKAALNLHMPDDVIFVDAIPLLGTGKLDLQGCKAAVANYYKNKQ